MDSPTRSLHWVMVVDSMGFNALVNMAMNERNSQTGFKICQPHLNIVEKELNIYKCIVVKMWVFLINQLLAWEHTAES